MKISLFSQTLLAFLISNLLAYSAPTTTNLVTASGRNWFYDNERIDLLIPSGKSVAKIELIHEDGTHLAVEAPAQNGTAYLNLLPNALRAGQWTIAGDGKQTGIIHIASPVPRTKFVMWNYQAWLDDDRTYVFGQMMGNQTTEERLQLYRDYEMNFLALQNGGFGMTVRTMDHIVQLGARYSSLNTMAGQHQPGGAHNDWSVPEVIMGTRFGAQNNAQYGRRFGAFAGVHFADEPALTYGTKNEKGEFEPYYDGHPVPDPARNYFGPFAVPAQMDLYVQQTGKKAIDPLNPSANMEGWLDFMRFRTTIMSNAFGKATEDLHQIDPKLIGYSQIYAWWFLSDGLYPLENAKGIDVLSSHAYIDNSLGMFYPVSETDMTRTGAWDKPFWMMPMFEGMTRPSVTYACLSRQIEGLGWDRTASFAQPGMKELSRRITPISGIFAEIRKRRDNVAVFYSRDQYLHDISTDVKNPDRAYAGRLVGTWMACFAAHYPANFVIEEEFLSGVAMRYKVIIAPSLNTVSPKTKELLEKYVKGGGTLVLEKDSPLQIAGAVKINTVFPDFSNTGKWNKQEESLNERQRIEKHIVPLIKPLTDILKVQGPPLIQGGDPLLFASLQEGGSVKYIWAVNMNHITVNEESPLATSFELPAGGVIYDVFNKRPVLDHKQNLNMPAGDAMLYAVLPEKITSVSITKPIVKQPYVTLGAIVQTAKGMLTGIVLLEVVITDGQGKIFKKLARATDATGKYADNLPLGWIGGTGEWKVTIKELLSNQSAETGFTSEPAKQPFATSGPVEVVDADHIFNSLKDKTQEVLILYGNDEMKPAAEKLAKVISSNTGKARIDKTENHMKERQGMANGVMYLSWYVAPLEINQPAIILGDRKSNPLIARLVDKLSMYPHPFSDRYPGKERGLLYWARSVFGFNQNVVIVYGETSSSVDSASTALDKILKGDRLGGNRVLSTQATR